MFVKVFYKNLTISLQKWQLNSTITIFPKIPKKHANFTLKTLPIL